MTNTCQTFHKFEVENWNKYDDKNFFLLSKFKVCVKLWSNTSNNCFLTCNEGSDCKMIKKNETSPDSLSSLWTYVWRTQARFSVKIQRMSRFWRFGEEILN